MNILWISPFAPYDTVGHGGGQNHNYSLKYIKKNTNFDIVLITVCEENEQDKIDLAQYSIKHILKVYQKYTIKSRIQVLMGKINVFRDGSLLNNAKRHLILESLKEYSKTYTSPNIVILHWTEAVMLIDEVKNYFPTSKYIAIEEDVAYLGFQRKYIAAKGFNRLYRKARYKFLKKKEIYSLRQVDSVVVLNDKDANLLINERIESEKILRMCPYYKVFENAVYVPSIHKLLFYGAMSRIENHESVIWLIKNVMPKLDKNYELYIIGSNPKDSLKKYENERIHVLGYVENIEPYFENCLCLIAPLLLGAGIKIKVLEALSSGLPVLTNDIGAEGIGLTDRVNYLHCESVDDYVKAIHDLSKDSNLRTMLSKNGKDYVRQYFNVSVGLNQLIEKLESW